MIPNACTARHGGRCDPQSVVFLRRIDANTDEMFVFASYVGGVAREFSLRVLLLGTNAIATKLPRVFAYATCPS